MSTIGTHYDVPGLPHTKRAAVQTFESLTAICEARLAAGTGARLSSHLSLTATPDWAGSKDMAEAISMLRHGAPHATATVRAYVAQATSTDRRPSWEHSVAGQRVCIASYVAGEPECMLVRDSEPERMPRIRLVASSNVLASYAAADVLRYAGAVASVIEALQTAGYDLAVIAAEFGQDISGYCHATPVSVLDFGQPVDISKVAFAFHPSMQRRVHFAVRELDRGYSDSLRDDGKGYTKPLRPEECAKLFPSTDDTLTVCLPCATDAIDATRSKGPDAMLGAMVALLQNTVDEAIAAALH